MSNEELSINDLKEIIKQDFENRLNLLNIRTHPKVLKTNEMVIRPKNTFVSFIGASCSGKSTFVKKHFQDRKGIKIERFDADDIQQEMAHAGFRDFDKVDMVEVFLKRVEKVLRRRADLSVIDNCNVMMDMRVRLLNRMKGLYNNSVLIGLNPTQEVINQQAKKRGSELGEREMFEQIMLELQFSDPEKYFVGYDRVLMTDTPRQANVIINSK